MSLKKYIQEHRVEFDDQRMSAQADEIFENILHQRLHQKQKNAKIIYLRYLSVAASIVVLLSVVFWVYKGNVELKKKQEIIADLTNDSTGKRLEAVYNFNDDFQKEDQQIIKILTNTLLTDKNSNVRIATIDALLKFPQNKLVRKTFLKALKTEKEPLVQIKLINSVSVLRDKRAQKPLENIIKNEETFEIVKNNATMAMANLKQ